MKIEIEIKDPPDGFSTPQWRPIYNPMAGIIILVGEKWCRAEDRLPFGGIWRICCQKLY